MTAQLQSSIWDRLHLLAGVRMAHVRIHSIDDAARTDYVTDSWKPLPRVGAVFDLLPGVSVFADYSQGYRGVGFFNTGSAPKPEEAEQTEGGLKLVLPSGFTSTLSFFTITRRNVVQPAAGQSRAFPAGRRAALAGLRHRSHLAAAARPFDARELRAHRCLS